MVKLETRKLETYVLAICSIDVPLSVWRIGLIWGIAVKASYTAWRRVCNSLLQTTKIWNVRKFSEHTWVILAVVEITNISWTRQKHCGTQTLSVGYFPINEVTFWTRTSSLGCHILSFSKAVCLLRSSSWIPVKISNSKKFGKRTFW